jgi:2-amino-4-hydroxy-6-hydroxymethyldihydropteridine diphosphokinase
VDDLNVVEAGIEEPSSEAIGVLRPRRCQPALKGPCVLARLDVQNPHSGAIHVANLAARPEEAKSVARRVRAYIGLGANLGDAEATLRNAVRALAALPGVHLAGVSRLYATRPVGVVDQPEFRNAVVALDVPAGPDPATGATALLVALKNLERAFGRRPRDHWGPRELDLDLLIFGRATLAIERPPEGSSLDAALDTAKAAKLLEVPHPLAHQRLFVLAPLADLARRVVPPGWGETVETARRSQIVIEGADAVRTIGIWRPSSQGWVTSP